MTCAVRGDPAPHVTWYHNNISLNTNANYYITNTCGVCSMLILRVCPNDMGEYKVIAENPLGRAESSTMLNVRAAQNFLKLSTSSEIMLKNPKMTDQTDDERVVIKKRSRVPGVMITQYVEQLPKGKSAPDITRKPVSLTINEGKMAIFRTVVTGDPTPTVTWRRNNGDLTDPEKYHAKYDDRTGENILEIPNVSVDEADTYKCFATNEFGKATCNVILNVTEVLKGEYCAKQCCLYVPYDNPSHRTVSKKKPPPKKEGEVDPQFWELLLSADRKDYERICLEHGFTDFRFMLKKLNQLKKEREEEQAKYVENITNLKPIEIKRDGRAEFEFDMELKDPNSNIFLFKEPLCPPPLCAESRTLAAPLQPVQSTSGKSIHPVKMKIINVLQDGEMIDYGKDNEMKHNMTKMDKRYTFSIKDLEPEDAGLYQVDVENTNIFSTELKIPPVEFLVEMKDVKAVEGEDSVFDCTLSCPLPSITWMRNSTCLEAGTKYDIIVSEDQLKHKLVVKSTKALDKGTYTALAGIRSSSASLIVEDDSGQDKHSKRRGGKTDRSGDRNTNLDKEAQEHQAKMQKVKDDKESARSAREGKGTGGAAVVASGTGREGRPGGHGNDSALSSGMSDYPGKGHLGGAGLGEKGAGDGASGICALGGERPRGTGFGEEKASDTALDRDGTDSKSKKCNRTGSLPLDRIKDHGAHFARGLSDVSALIGQPAEMVCMLSNEKCNGVWYKDGKKLKPTDGVVVTKDGRYCKLTIKNCKESDSGKYRFETDGGKTEAVLNVRDPPKFDSKDLGKFSEPAMVRAGENAIFKMCFAGRKPLKVQWYKDGDELLDDPNIKVETTSTHSCLLLSKCQRKDSGEIKIKIKNEFGTTEALSKLLVLDKPTPPQGPVEVIESSAKCIEIKWRQPKDDGGSPVTHYILERQQVGRSCWKHLEEIPGKPTYKDTDVDHGRKYCYRIRAKSAEGVSEMMETEDIMAGTKAFPNSPAAPKVVSAFKDCINLSWTAPTNSGGSYILGYHLEKRKKGSNVWTSINPVDEPIKDKKYAVSDVVEGTEYEFRVTAVSASGPGEPSAPSHLVVARDPTKYPGKITDLKVIDSTNTSLTLSWNKPTVEKGLQDEAKGYFVEMRPAESSRWVRCNTNPITMTSYTVKGLKSMAMYWVRVIPMNEGGEGEPQELDKYILVMPPPVRPDIKKTKEENFKVIRVGNTVRINVTFTASPFPDIIWLKDGVPVSKRVTISNTEDTSQLLIPTSERSDTGIYTVIVKNLFGQETISFDIRVTDDPKSPGPVTLEQNVPGTVTLSWASSPDESLDNRLHYMVCVRDTSKRGWQTLADRLFNNKFTVTNITPGHEYQFRVYAKNDIGFSEPSKSSPWGTKKKKDKFKVDVPEMKAIKFQTPPTFLVPLKMHSAPQGYECHMSCAVRGNPVPHVTWYHNNISLNTNTNYYITNTCGVCSMVILRVGPSDNGEYKVIAENPLGRAECSAMLTLR
ncbi:immunoglobulin-like and fibronectin type III domain-containing protein 1-like, partial [Scleropages formosus]